ncbi:MAG: hypothetical protein NVS2B16_00830 [Chloroflexota bacterium]
METWESVHDETLAALAFSRPSEFLFRGLVEDAPIGILVWNLEGIIVFANEAAQSMLGYSLEELRGSHRRLVAHPGDADWFPDDLVAAGARSLAGPFEQRYLRKGGGVLWGHVHVATVRVNAGDAELVAAFIEDVTCDKVAHQGLPEIEEVYRTLVETYPDAVILFDLAGTVVMANEGAALLHGYSHSHDLLGLSGPDLLTDDLWRELTDHARTAAPISTRESRECWIRTRDGARVPIDVRMTPIVGEQGTIKWILAWERDIGEYVLAKQALEYQAMHDGLTGLPNRSLLSDRIGQLIRVAQREQGHFALLLLDLDRFKEVNDTFGHFYGDLLLQQLGGRLVTALRGSDTVARLGGDEFAMLLPSTDESGAVEAISKLLHVFDRPFVLEGKSAHVAGSIGIAVFPEHGSDASLLMRRADDAMYAAKRRRLGYAVFRA